MKTVRVRITGRVQGVGYRYGCREAALSHGVSGWVRNRGDGSVEALLAGEDDAVDALLAWCRQGPAMGRVDSVDAERVSETREVDGFEIR